MKTTLAVAAREIVERRLVLLGTLLVGLLPLTLPFLPGLGGAGARDVRFVAAFYLALTIAVAFPIAFGATILVSEITQKRIAFYFSRPLPPVSIWAGKLLGALFISVSGACLAAIPTILVDGKRAFAAFDTSGPATVYFVLTTLLLLAGAHTFSSMVRLRSAWIVLDFLLAALFAALIALSLRSLFLAGFWNLYEMKHSPEWLAWWLAAPLITALLAASYMQVADGRTDARRSHGALSVTLWGLTALLALPLGGLALWVNAATPKDLVHVDGIQAAPHGTWVGVAGAVRSRGSAEASFIFDAMSGRFVKCPFSWDGTVAFSADGTRAAWGEPRFGFFEMKDNRLDLFVADLSAGRPVATGLEPAGWATLALSPSGRRLASFDGKTLAAFDVSDAGNPKQIAVFRIARDLRYTFVDEDTIRAFPRFFNTQVKGLDLARLDITEFSLSSKKSLVTGRFEPGTLPFLRLSADARFLVGTRRTKDDPSAPQILTLHDGRTGAHLMTLSEDLEAPRVRFLSGGRMAVAGVADGKGILKIFLEGERSPARSIELGPAAGAILGGEVSPGRVAVALTPFRSNDERSRSAWKIVFVDTGTGAVSAGPDGLVPADRFSSWFSPVLQPAEAGLPSSCLFLDAERRLVRIDPATGAQTVLLGRSK